jgi:starch synthase
MHYEESEMLHSGEAPFYEFPLRDLASLRLCGYICGLHTTMSDRPLRVLFAVPECAPVVKTGGLGDVAGSLPAALRTLDVDVKVLLPGYRRVKAALTTTAPVARLAASPHFPAASILSAVLPNGIALWVLDCPELFDRPGGPYQDQAGEDWPDNALRFGLFSRVAALLSHDGSPVDWRPDVLHAHDWQTALAPLFLRHMAPGNRAATLMTIHNLAFQGIFASDWHGRLGLPPATWSMHGAEFYGQLSFLKAGLYYADAVSTVSPTHAREIQSQPLGMGLEGLLAGRRDALHGILNGIDTELWNPKGDPLIPARYDARSLARKIENKRALQERFGLTATDERPLLGSVSRFTHQKGVDLIAELASEMIAFPAQLVVVGTGEPEQEARFRELALRQPGSAGVFVGYDERLAHLVEAGADMFLMPSRFEPCGMNQMFSQRYGTPPIANATGGLLDSVVDCSAATLADGTASGFLMKDATAESLRAAITRALAVYSDRIRWRQLQRNGMDRDFSWGTSARRYLDLYAKLAAGNAAVTPRSSAPARTDG